MLQILPLGLERSLVWHGWFLSSVQSGVQEIALMGWFSDALVQEDMGICEKVQKALNSRGYKQGKFVVNRAHPELSELYEHFFQ